MRVVVTGASGFIGRMLVPVLRARGHEVATPGREATGDLAQAVDWRAPLAGAEAVVHLAALAHARGVGEARLRRVNLDAALALGEAAATAGARLLFMSTVKVLGEETQQVMFHETSALAPEDAYARAKADAETALRAVSGLALTVLRAPLVYGPGVRANFLALLRAVAQGWPLPFASIANQRSLLYAGNLADAVARCLESPASAARTYAVTDGPPLSTPALCRALGIALGRPARLFPFPPMLLPRKLTCSLVVDDSTLRRELGWRPPYSFEEGVRHTAEWYQTRGG
jgi:UDP-N-acetyl-alpha-D-quinovosamine dehydrogenase